MIAACKLLHLLEAFTTPWFLFSSPTNHHLVFFLLEIFNNVIQYQFDGNSNLVYSIIRKRQVFHHLANLPTDCGSINRTLNRRGGAGGKRQQQQQHYAQAQQQAQQQQAQRQQQQQQQQQQLPELPIPVGATPLSPMEGSKPAQPAEPGTLKVTYTSLPSFFLKKNPFPPGHPDGPPRHRQDDREGIGAP